MFDTLMTVLFALLPLLMIVQVVRDWRKTRKPWLWLIAVLFAFAVVEVILDWSRGVLALLFALVVYVIVGRLTKK